MAAKELREHEVFDKAVLGRMRLSRTLMFSIEMGFDRVSPCRLRRGVRDLLRFLAAIWGRCRAYGRYGYFGVPRPPSPKAMARQGSATLSGCMEGRKRALTLMLRICYWSVADFVTG